MTTTQLNTLSQVADMLSEELFRATESWWRAEPAFPPQTVTAQMLLDVMAVFNASTPAPATPPLPTPPMPPIAPPIRGVVVPSIQFDELVDEHRTVRNYWDMSFQSLVGERVYFSPTSIVRMVHDESLPIIEVKPAYRCPCAKHSPRVQQELFGEY
jgi:hypothetical protein